jgi:TonB family protein
MLSALEPWKSFVRFPNVGFDLTLRNALGSVFDRKDICSMTRVGLHLLYSILAHAVVASIVFGLLGQQGPSVLIYGHELRSGAPGGPPTSRRWVEMVEVKADILAPKPTPVIKRDSKPLEKVPSSGLVVSEAVPFSAPPSLPTSSPESSHEDSETPGQGGAHGNAEGALEGVQGNSRFSNALGLYLRSVTERVRRGLETPKALERDHRTVLRLSLAMDGALTRLELRQSSGISELDQMALRAAREGHPFSPLPEELKKRVKPGDSFHVVLPIDFRVQTSRK